MKQFLAVYTGTRAARADSGWDAMDPAQREMRGIAGKTKRASRSGEAVDIMACIPTPAG